MTRVAGICFLLALLGGLALPVADAQACTCAVAREGGHQERQLRQADAVFTGRVLLVTDPQAGAALRSSADPVVATVAVTDVRKGDLRSSPFSAGLCGGSERIPGDALPPRHALDGAPRVHVVTARFSASCGVEFRDGQAWTVYATRREEPLPITKPVTSEEATDDDGPGWFWPGLAAAAVGLAVAATLVVLRRRFGG